MPVAQESRLIAFSRACFGLGVAAIGVQHFVIRNFVNVVLPFRVESPLWPWVVGALLGLAGAALAFNRAARPVSLLLGAFFAAGFVFAFVPDAITQARQAPPGTTPWQLLYLGTTPLKAAVFAGGAWLIASLYPGGTPRSVRVLRLSGACTFGFFLLYCGVEHFVYLPFVASLIGSWIPGHIFWTGFAGVALIAGGLGLLSGICAPQAGGLAGLMIFLWVFLLHIPRAIADPVSLHGNECTSVFEAVAFSGLGFILWRVLPRRAER